MLTNSNGNTVKFERIDEWVIRLTFLTKCHHDVSCMLTFDCTLNLLTDEIKMLDYPNPVEPKKGVFENECHKRID